MFKNAKIVAIGGNAEEYHSQTVERGDKAFVMSSSALRSVFAYSPSKWFHGWTLTESASLEYGSLVDCMVLTPELFKVRYAFEPAEYTNEKGEVKPWSNNAKVCRAWNEDQKSSGKEIVSDSEYAEAKAAVKRLWDDEQIHSLLNACQKQVWVTAEWHDDATGLIIPCKCLIDLVGKNGTPWSDTLGDLKTTKNAATVAWSRWADFAGYDIQAAWNLDMLAAATGTPCKSFCWVLSESEPPYEVGRRYATFDELEPGQDSGALASGRRQYVKMLKNYCLCLKTGKWPGYDDTDEASQTGWTLLAPDPWAEQRRQFAPKFSFGQEEEPSEPQEIGIDLNV